MSVKNPRKTLLERVRRGETPAEVVAVARQMLESAPQVRRGGR